MGSDPIAEGSDPWAQSIDAVAWMSREGLTPAAGWHGSGGFITFGQNGIDRRINIVYNDFNSKRKVEIHDHMERAQWNAVCGRSAHAV